MHFRQLFAALLGATSLTRQVAADQRITKDLHSFGGVNFPGLQYLPHEQRDDAIRNIVKSNTRVIRLFSRFTIKMLRRLFTDVTKSPTLPYIP